MLSVDLAGCEVPVEGGRGVRLAGVRCIIVRGVGDAAPYGGSAGGAFRGVGCMWCAVRCTAEKRRRGRLFCNIYKYRSLGVAPEGADAVGGIEFLRPHTVTDGLRRDNGHVAKPGHKMLQQRRAGGGT